MNSEIARGVHERVNGECVDQAHSYANEKDRYSNRREDCLRSEGVCASVALEVGVLQKRERTHAVMVSRLSRCAEYGDGSYNSGEGGRAGRIGRGGSRGLCAFDTDRCVCSKRAARGRVILWG